MPALETLAVIAYRQPVTAPEIAEIRGVNTSGVLNTLIERKLVKIVGRKPVVGRPFMYGTTRDFLDKFGLNDLSDLPKVEDLADVLGFDPPALAELDAHRAAAGLRLRRCASQDRRRRPVAAHDASAAPAEPAAAAMPPPQARGAASTSARTRATASAIDRRVVSRCTASAAIASGDAARLRSVGVALARARSPPRRR